MAITSPVHHFPAVQSSSFSHIFVSVVRKRALLGLRCGEDKKGNCGRGREFGVSTFWVKGRGELGGRKGRRRSIRRMGRRGRILGRTEIFVLWVGLYCEMLSNFLEFWRSRSHHQVLAETWNVRQEFKIPACFFIIHHHVLTCIHSTIAYQINQCCFNFK